jgi:hypothetical protein
MADHAPVEADPQEIRRAEEMWRNVNKAARLALGLIILIMAGLAVTFIDWS